jgi:3',5'-cyclic AMP phosphodiesterase CpdA
MPQTTLLLITDTHAGAGAGGFQQQPRCPDLLPEIYAGVRALAAKHHPDLVLHAGDITDNADLNHAALMLRALDLPLAACLGNHDLTRPDSHAKWRALDFPALKLADAVLSLDQVDVILLNNLWRHGQDAALFWDGANPIEALVDRQLQWLDRELSRNPDRPACLLVHAPPDAIPPRLTRLAHDIHKPQPPYSASLNKVLDAHPRTKLVLSGHNHVNCATAYPRRHHLTTASISEVPFELRLIRFSPGSLRVETLPAIQKPPDSRYDQNKAWANGRPEDRTIDMTW